MTRSYERPDVLVGLDYQRPAVIEASAGTGKTHTLEHLVVDLLTCSAARIEEILVVTFTEKAAAELRTRIRSKLASLVAPASPKPLGRADSGEELDHGDASRPVIVTLDEPALQRLRVALADFDRATITTLHGYCQRVLTEHAFAHRRLLQQARVDERAAFDEAFSMAVRHHLAVEPQWMGWLAAAFEVGLPPSALCTLLWSAHRAPGALYPPLDEEGLTHIARELEALADRGLRVGDVAWPGGKPVQSRAAALETLLERFGRPSAGRWDLPRLCAGFDEEQDGKKPFVELLGGKLESAKSRPTGAGGRERDAARLVELFHALARMRTPFDAAVCAALLPPVQHILRAKKAAHGLFDFQDLLALVDASLHGSEGDALARTLRARHPFALIDEFQDTDPVQWRIFRRIYVGAQGADATLERASRGALFLVGDPKQAIYAFRGADVRTYFAARREIEEAGGSARSLDTSYRSTPAMLAAHATLFDAEAAQPFFTGVMRGAPPLRAGRANHGLVEAGRAALPVVCWGVEPTAPGRVIRIPEAKRALIAAMTRELTHILSGGLRYGARCAEAPIPAREIFVLTRTLDESHDVGDALAKAGVPHTFYKQEGLLQSTEAYAWLALLGGVARPDDRAARLAAWHTPFFGLSLDALALMEPAGPAHPAWERLQALRALASQSSWSRFFAQALDESGVVRRLRFAGGQERTLTNLVHIGELLLAEATRTRTTLAELEHRLTAFVAGRAAPDGLDANLERQGRSDDAVQIMTMHKSKGLQATVVFLYGGYGRRPSSGLRPVHYEGERIAVFGNGHTRALEAAVKNEAEEEDQRLLYVALTRARARVYTAHFTVPPNTLAGAHRLLEPHLHRLLAAGQADLRTLPSGAPHTRTPTPPRASPTPPERRDTANPLPSANVGAGRSTTTPVPRDVGLGDAAGDARVRRLVAERVGPVVTSYSRLKLGRAARTLTEAPEGFDHDARLSEPPAPRPTEPPPGELPPGPEVGVFLHALLETCELSLICSYAHMNEWLADQGRTEQFERLAQAHGRALSECHAAARLVWAGLKSPLRLGRAGDARAPVLNGLATTSACVRELEFLLTFPRRPGTARAANDAFVKGFIDVLFEHEGRAYILDWKSDVLDDYGQEQLAAHVRAAYHLQGYLYVLAACRALGVRDEADYDARVGGFVYVFLRGLDGATPDRGVYFERPSFAELRDFEAALGESGPFVAPEAWS